MVYISYAWSMSKAFSEAVHGTLMHEQICTDAIHILLMFMLSLCCAASPWATFFVWIYTMCQVRNTEHAHVLRPLKMLLQDQYLSGL